MTMTGVGVDWASGYWIATEYGDEVDVEAFPSILNVWHKFQERADRILVDIPIGLPDEETLSQLDGGRRLCDQEARNMLTAPLTSSVFATPCRKAVYADTYEEARAENEDILNRGLGSQSWSLVPRIQEVEVFLCEVHNDANGPEVRESHPEVCFAALAALADENLSITKRKSAEDGIGERKAVLEAYRSELVETYDRIEDDLKKDGAHGGWKRRITSTRLDDVLDALALALTASRGGGHLESLPKKPPEPPTDGAGLPMEIVYPV